MITLTLTLRLADELDALARIASNAFATDLATMVSLGGDESLLLPFERAVLAASAIGGRLYTASVRDAPPAGVAAWFPPGCNPFSSEDQRNAGFNQLFSSISPELKGWWMDYFLPKWETQVETSIGQSVKLSSWHLQLIAVAPGMQGKGIGKALLDVGEEKAFQDGSILYLETGSERNVALYARRGYEVRSQETYQGLADNFQSAVMTKTPRSA